MDGVRTRDRTSEGEEDDEGVDRPLTQTDAELTIGEAGVDTGAEAGASCAGVMIVVAGVVAAISATATLGVATDGAAAVVSADCVPTEDASAVKEATEDVEEESAAVGTDREKMAEVGAVDDDMAETD